MNILERWQEVLRRGDRKHTRRVLKETHRSTGEASFCAIGMLLDELKEELGLRWGEPYDDELFAAVDWFIEFSDGQPVGSGLPDLMGLHGIDEALLSRVIQANDELGRDPKQIADLIEDYKMGTRYVIEARNEDGSLKFDCEQPPVKDWTEEDLADLVFKHNPDAVLNGMHLLRWVSDNVNPFWITRQKAW